MRSKSSRGRSAGAAALPLTSPASKPSTERVSCLQQQLSWGARDSRRWGLSDSLFAKLVRVTAEFCWGMGWPQEGLLCRSASPPSRSKPPFPQKVILKGVPCAAGGGEAAGHAQECGRLCGLALVWKGPLCCKCGSGMGAPGSNHLLELYCSESLV